ncbi:MAG: uroporphyrinogen-III synthase, partial [Planctomycetota bacterium]
HCQPDLMPDTHDSWHLAQAMQAAGADKADILYPCQEQGGGRLTDYLIRAGSAVQRLAVYKQASPVQVMQLLDEAVDGVCLSSPSAVRRLLHCLTPDALRLLLQHRPCFFAIGKSTAAAMVKAEIPVDAVAPDPNSASLVDMVTAHFAPSASI